MRYTNIYTYIYNLLKLYCSIDINDRWFLIAIFICFIQMSEASMCCILYYSSSVLISIFLTMMHTYIYIYIYVYAYIYIYTHSMYLYCLGHHSNLITIMPQAISEASVCSVEWQTGGQIALQPQELLVYRHLVYFLYYYYYYYQFQYTSFSIISIGFSIIRSYYKQYSDNDQGY